MSLFIFEIDLKVGGSLSSMYNGVLIKKNHHIEIKILSLNFPSKSLLSEEKRELPEQALI